MLLTKDQAKELVKQILAEKWMNDRSAILGARLKSLLMDRARTMGAEFDEKSLGYVSFTRFVQDTDAAIIKYRGSNDVLIASKDHAELLDEQGNKPLRIRRAFWDAFVRFPMPGEYRGYNPNTDEIVIGSAPDVITNAVAIQPIRKELQLDWRREFVSELGPDSPLAVYEKTFTPKFGFALFSHLLNQHGQFRGLWGRVFSDKVNECIADWAKRYGILEGVWLESPLEQIQDNVRGQLYTILDRVPIEELVELRIPLKWLLEPRKTR